MSCFITEVGVWFRESEDHTNVTAEIKQYLHFTITDITSLIKCFTEQEGCVRRDKTRHRLFYTICTSAQSFIL